MDIRVLGPLEVVADGVTIPIGGPRQRLVLALLTIDANTIVPTDRLINGVWEDEPPDAARRTLQAYVSNLRRVLEPLRGGTLTARPPGYLLNVEPGMVDAKRFEDLAHRGSEIVASDPAGAASLLREGLSLWRGTPYADVSGAPVLRPEITRLEELRTAAIESRIAADLALGLDDEVIGELEALIADHPFNERFHAQLMTALYRSGRQADALQVYRRVRATLAEELGLDPGPELQELEQAILDHDVGLILPDADDAFIDVTPPELGRSDTNPRNPYKGLSPFDEADADDFFGREQLVSSITMRIATLRPRCVSLVGASGVGKSSILGAGLIPALRRGDVPESASWVIVRMHPGSHPHGQLAIALREVAHDPTALELARLTWGDIDIAEAVDAAVPDPSTRVFLVIDQFEELFTLVPSESVTSSFIDHLVAAVCAPTSRIRIAIALRADFYDRPLRYRRFSALLTECLFTVTPMAVDDLHRAVIEPAANVGVRLDPGLAGRIVDDVAGQPGALPLLQYAMTNLFEHRSGNRLTSRAYEEAGGVRGPLGRRPEAIYRDLTPEQQLASHQMFLRLVAVSTGTPPTRRRVSYTELTSIVRFGPVMRSVIDAFGDARLLTFDVDATTRSPTVEIAHEALIREWPRLRRWIDDQRHDVATHQRLAEATSDWEDSGRNPEFLLSGGLLTRLATWASSSDFVLSEEERALLSESAAAAVADQAGEVERIEHTRELEARSRRHFRILLATWVVVAAVAVLAVFSFAQWRNAQVLAAHARVVAVADHLAAMGTALTSEDPQLGALLALRAAEITIEAGADVTPTIRDAVAVSVAALQGTGTDAALTEASGGRGSASLDELIATTRSLLTRGFTPTECSAYLGLSICPVDTIASPLTAGTG